MKFVNPLNSFTNNIFCTVAENEIYESNLLSWY